MSFPEMIRNVAIVGHLHHGKTALMDALVLQTHKLIWNADHQVCVMILTRLLAYSCVGLVEIHRHPCSIA